jgi:hypothetical protein
VPDNKEFTLISIQSGILALGALCGFFLSWVAAGVHWDFSADLSKARELGIVSWTVLKGYPKARDVVTYATVFGFPAFFALLFWSIWAWKRRSKLIPIYNSLWDDRPVHHNKRWLISLILLAAIFIIAYFPTSTFFDVKYVSGNVKAWPFIGEEGEILAWVQFILNGGIYGKDFFCLYGPLMLYPLAFLEKVFGPSVSIARFYTFSLDLIAYSIVIFLIYRIFRSKIIAIVFLLTYLTLYNHLMTVLSPNTSFLRVALGLAPLLLMYDYLETKKILFIVFAGLMTSASLLFSQEVGLCSIISVCLVLSLVIFHRKDIHADVHAFIFYLAATVAGVIPFLLYQGIHGSLGVFFESLVGYPRLVMLGFGGMPFPDFHYALSHLFEPIVFDNYWVLFTLVALALSVFPLILLGQNKPLLLFRLSLLIFGALLYRSALGRSSLDRAFYVSLPALSFLFLYIDNAWTCFRFREAPLRAVHLGRVILTIGILILIFINDRQFKQNAEIVLPAVQYKWTNTYKRPPSDYNAFLPRLNVYTDDQTYANVNAISGFINKKNSHDILFFPNEPMYYFLFNITPPTRYVMSYFAVTHDMRREMVYYLEQNPPRYVIYNKNTWRLDDIPENIQVPEVLDYVTKTYHPIEESDDLIFLERNQI